LFFSIGVDEQRETKPKREGGKRKRFYPWDSRERERERGELTLGSGG